MDYKRIILSLNILCFCNEVVGQFSDNTPPIMWLDRNWRIPSTEPVGSVITRVKAQDNEKDVLEFGLEPSVHHNQGSSRLGPPASLPFYIDNRTGVVYLNESLRDRVGEDMLLYVTVFDGKLLAKNEVRVNIVNDSAPLDSYRGNHPIRPPFLNFPPGFGSRQPSLQSNRPLVEYPLSTYNYKPTIRTPSTKIHLQPVEINSTLIENETPTTKSKSDQMTTTVITTTTSINSLESNLSLHPTDLPVKSPPDLTVTLIPVVSVCVIFLVVGIFVILLRKKIYWGRTKDNKDDMTKESNGGIVLHEDPSLAMQNWHGPRAFSNRYESWNREGNHAPVEEQSSVPEKITDKWEFPRHRLKIFNILGEGAFGQVWKCEAMDIGGKEGISVVAVKTLKENATEKERSDLVSELQVMKMLEPHPNVVRLLGCCTEKEPYFVIMEYISHGKLQSFLRNSRAERYYGNMHGKSKSLTSRDLTSFVYQVARGMDYLSSKGIIHRDLAARNILITDEHTCKVADFGFARDVMTTHVYERKSEGRLPIRWMAPESLYDNVFSVKSDVWSFGVLIWEVVTLGSTPYPGLSAADVMRKVRDGHRLDKPEHCRRELYNIMYYCWDKEPNERPSFTECVELLEKLLLTETDYIELERFPDHSYYNMLSLSGEKL